MPENPYASPAAGPPEIEALARLWPPAILLLAISSVWIIALALCSPVWLPEIFDPAISPKARQVPIQVTVFVISNFCVSIIISVGAGCMMRRGPRWAAFAGAWAAMLPFLGPWFLICIPLGIWAHFVLRRPDVKAAFNSADASRT